ncbi:MAG: hypothetical protein ABIR46_01415 [Candidatus Saccharimonadales bacterium]
MYSGTTLRTASGNVMGAHQRIDRIAKRHFNKVMPRRAFFPTVREILKFEGRDGPDGIKRKSPSRDEPWHFIDPQNSEDVKLLDMIDDHMVNLERALFKRDNVRAAFEAAWLAHAIVDGLTPAHHYPFESKLEELRGGLPMHTRNTLKTKLILPGETRRHQLRNNWAFWGAKGVMTTHGLFELGFATTISSLRLDQARPTHNELIRVKQEGIRAVFLENLHHIHDLKMYETFHKKGWNRSLARQTRTELAPRITKVVVLAWYAASLRAEKRRKGEKS